MSRFCKTCHYLVADKDALRAECTFWVAFGKAFPMPWARISSPQFQAMPVLPRHVWDDLPRASELAGIDASCVAGPWSEVMDCPHWSDRSAVVPALIEALQAAAKEASDE